MTGSSPGMPRAVAPWAIQMAMSGLGAVSPGYGVAAGHSAACASEEATTGATSRPASRAWATTLRSLARTA